MKKFIYLPLLLSLSAQAVVENPVIYGEDDRIELKDASAMQKELARGTAVMVPKERIKKRLFSSKASFVGVNTFNEQVLDYEGIPLCEEERFRKEVTAGVCSGFLIGPNTLVTAGHCLMTEEQCKSNDWVFDFSLDEKGKYTINKKNIYSCEKIVAWKNDFISGLDYAIIKLSKRVKDRKPLEIRRSGKIEDNTEVMVIGNPYGLSTKVAAGATVLDNTDETFFQSDLDTLQGNSGSAIFNAKTGVVEGILVRGEEDFDYDYEKECFKSKRCEGLDDCRGEDVIRITALPEISNGGKVHVLAKEGEDLAGMERILDLNPWIDVIDEQGASPLMVAAKNNNLKMVDLLLNMGADINHQDINGNTALHLLAQMKMADSAVAQLLLERGAKTSIKNVHGQSFKRLVKGLK